MRDIAIEKKHSSEKRKNTPGGGQVRVFFRSDLFYSRRGRPRNAARSLVSLSLSLSLSVCVCVCVRSSIGTMLLWFFKCNYDILKNSFLPFYKTDGR
jgi:hypothetical protein